MVKTGLRFQIKKTLSGLWRWSWLVTLPFAVVTLYWMWAVAQRYYQFGVVYDSRAMPSSLYNIGKMEFQCMVAQAQQAMRFERLSAPKGLRVVDLFLETAAEKRLNSNLPHSGQHYEKAQLLYPDGDIHPVKVKYRGDFSQHWGHYKKSTRIKTKKEHLMDGMRAFNLNAPKFEGMLHNHLGYELARDLGLLAPHSEMVFYRINGKFRGVHLLVEQLDEGTLRRNNRMPGDVYSGELVGKDQYKGLDSNVFLYPGVWEKIAINNHFDPNSIEPLKKLTTALNSSNRQEATAMLDPETWARFSLFEILTQCFHFDKGHNWRLFFDPAKSRFEPIVWDPVAWHPYWQPSRPNETRNADVILTSLHEALVSDYRFLAARHDAMRRFFQTGQDQAFLKKARQVIEELKPVVDTDPYITSQFEHFTPQESKDAMDALYRSIEETFSEIRKICLDDEGEVAYKPLEQGAIGISISGRSPVRELEITFDRTLEKGFQAK